MSGDRRVRLSDLALRPVVAHGGQGTIGFARPLDGDEFEGPVHFVDYAVLPPGASIGEHTHGRDEEIYLVLEGRGTMTRDGGCFAVQAGDVIVNRAGGRHGLLNDADEPLRLFVVEIGLCSRAAEERPAPEAS